jgi:hypothetical protein
MENTETKMFAEIFGQAFLIFNRIIIRHSGLIYVKKTKQKALLITTGNRVIHFQKCMGLNLDSKSVREVS